MKKRFLIGTVFRAITGGNFGAWIKFAGYDLIIIEGKAHRASYVHIGRESIRSLDAEPLRNADPSTGQVVKDLDTLLDEYYQALGYTNEGVPTIEKLVSF